MAVEIRVPPLGESLVDAVVGAWLKGEGEEVSRGETIVELETDKVNLDVTAPDDGILSKIEKQEGDVVTVGEVLAHLTESADGAVSAPTPAPIEARPEPTAEVVGAPTPTAQAPTPPPAPVPIAAAPTTDGASRAAPAVRRLAEEHNLDLNTIIGTGPGGRITREDVMAQAARQISTPSAPPTPLTPSPAAGTAPGAIATAPAPTITPTIPTPPAPAPAPAPTPTPTPAPPPVIPSGRAEERVRFTRRRQTIAQRLVEAQHTAAMLTTFNEVDMSAIMAIRSRRKDAFKDRHGVGLGFMSFFTKAVVGALKAFPEVNSELQGDQLVLKKYYDIGIAVSTDEGLVVPVVRDADKKTFAEIEREIADLATRARDSKLTLEELQGGTFTITNGGIFGSLLSTPILNTPQVGILGMHAIQQRPVARDGEVVIRPMMYVALSYDHRVVDGSSAVRFLVRVKELLEDPETLLLEG